MMGFTADGQVHDELVEARDRRLGIDTARKRRNRTDIPMPTPVSGANAWESGRTVQTTLEAMDL
jgi:hypothetical protein